MWIETSPGNSEDVKGSEEDREGPAPHNGKERKVELCGKEMDKARRPTRIEKLKKWTEDKHFNNRVTGPLT